MKVNLFLPMIEKTDIFILTIFGLDILAISAGKFYAITMKRGFIITILGFTLQIMEVFK